MRNDPDAFIDSLVGDLEPVAPLRQRTGMTWVLLALVAGAFAILIAFGPRADLLNGRLDPIFLVSTGLFLVLALATAWAAIDMARPFVGTRRDGWGWTALMAAVLPGAALGLIASNLLRGHDAAVDAGGYFCLTSGTLTGLVMACALVIWLKRGAPACPRKAGLYTGVAAGAAGIFAVSIHCPYNDLIHIGIWHGGTVILSGLTGRLALPRLLNW
jgi:hypothetical protein